MNVPLVFFVRYTVRERNAGCLALPQLSFKAGVVWEFGISRKDRHTGMSEKMCQVPRVKTYFCVILAIMHDLN